MKKNTTKIYYSNVVNALINAKNELAKFFNSSCISGITLNKIDKIYSIAIDEHKDIIDKILKFNPEQSGLSSLDERSFPGYYEFIDSGYYHVMLKRYFFAGKYICNNLNVIDTCCGLGWGTFIISKFAKNIVSVDLNSDAINFCKNYWDLPNVSWVCGDCTDLNFVGDTKFDVALAMETIEHFNIIDGDRYIRSVSNKLKNNGILIGTSSFPYSELDAQILCERNTYHKHIFTIDEINNILEKYFSRYTVINNWMFIAKK